ncbi:hypothetical protein ACHAWU_007141 [Discostella pseudostelligera]|uniref:Ubiquinone biosynthesis protein COQ4 homolog, mitochondrial n=1 Tax=Discostella pseudostelligera TaxID=259834 RepID=A0ABD3LWR0_9STRA
MIINRVILQLQQRSATRRLFPRSIYYVALKSPSSPSPSSSSPHSDCRKCFLSSSSSSSSTAATPFYGAARPLSSRFNTPSRKRENEESSNLSTSQSPNAASHRQQHPHNHNLPQLTPLQRLATLIHSSLAALSDPTRADAVAAVGEVTGSYALSKVMAGMMNDNVGRRILHERPLVDEFVASRALEMLQTYNADNNMTMDASNSDGSSKTKPDSSGTTTTKSPSLGREVGAGDGGGRIPFGVAYGKFLQLHEFDPNERSSVRFISDPDLSYVMTRYRQCHDYWHVLTGLPPTVLGELALKWVELLQTGLPLAALSATGGAWGVSSMNDREREVLWNVYLPWAVHVGGNMKPHALMCVYYEEEFETDLNELRERVGIELAPRVEV